MCICTGQNMTGEGLDDWSLYSIQSYRKKQGLEISYGEHGGNKPWESGGRNARLTTGCLVMYIQSQVIWAALSRLGDSLLAVSKWSIVL
jgi:hypothetical protein